jgi:hypothetical protein
MELNELDPLLGEWTTTAVFPGRDEPVLGRTTFARLEGGGYLIQRAVADEPSMPNGVMLLGPAHDDERIVQHYFDSRGVARIYEVALADGVWRLWRDAREGDFAQRFEGRFSADGATIDGAWERSDDGVEWQRDFPLTYSRVG